MPVTDFGTQEIYDDAFISYLIENIGEGGSVLNGSFSFQIGGGPFTILEGDPNYSIPIGGSHLITVRFSSSTIGVFNDVALFSGGGGESIDLSGETTALTGDNKIFEDGDNKTNEDPSDNTIPQP